MNRSSNNLISKNESELNLKMSRSENGVVEAKQKMNIISDNTITDSDGSNSSFKKDKSLEKDN